MKYVIGDVIKYKEEQYRVDGILKDQYSLTLLTDTLDDIVHQRKGWKVDKDATPISLVPRTKPAIPKTEKKYDSIFDKLKFWS